MYDFKRGGTRKRKSAHRHLAFIPLKQRNHFSFCAKMAFTILRFFSIPPAKLLLLLSESSKQSKTFTESISPRFTLMKASVRDIIFSLTIIAVTRTRVRITRDFSQRPPSLAGTML